VGARGRRGVGGRIRVGVGAVNSRQHVQPRKNDLGGQCSSRKQATVVRRRGSITSPLSPIEIGYATPVDGRGSTKTRETGERKKRRRGRTSRKGRGRPNGRDPSARYRARRLGDFWAWIRGESTPPRPATLPGGR